MRRASALFAVPLVAAAAFVAGCSSTPSDPNASVHVSGKFGTTPKVTIPAQPAGSKLYTKTLIKGSGAALTSADSFEGSYEAYDWSGKTHKLLMSTYSTHTPSIFPGQLIPGLTAALKGAKEGSRVEAVIPPKEGFGSQGNPQLGVKATDTLVFVIDVTKKIPASPFGKQVSSGGGSLPKVSDAAPGQQPAVTIPGGSAPGKLSATTLIKGTGPKVSSGEGVLVNYEGVNWRTKKPFDSSWARKQPAEIELTDSSPQGGVIPGWVKGLTGQTVGSRVLLVIPPSDGYGKQGQPQAGIKPTDDLVFVVDILDAVKPPKQ